jgi:hypothetical protein
MLAKAKSDILARRAALSAPSHFLSRLLLCSGLPRASLLTMVDRLGRLGSKSDQMDAVFADLLTPSASSAWDIGRVGRRRDLARNLLGRLSAYFRLNGISTDDKYGGEINMTFLTWLSDHCKSTVQPKARKTKQKRPRVVQYGCLADVRAASSLLSNLDSERSGFITDDQVDLTSDSVETFQEIENNDPTMPSLVTDGPAVADYVTLCVKHDKFVLLDAWFEANFENDRIDSFLRKSVMHRQYADIAFKLIESISTRCFVSNGMSSAVLKWLPRLSSSGASPELWRLLFVQHLTSEGLRDPLRANLLACAVQSWSSSHVSDCSEWIMQLSPEEANAIDCELASLFLKSACEQPSANVEALFGPSIDFGSSWAGTREFVISATRIALISFKQMSHSESKNRLRGRHGLPAGFDLVFLLAKCGKNQLRCVCEEIAHELINSGEEEGNRSVFGNLLLRLYLCFPNWMDLGSAAARQVLMSAAEDNAANWLSWRSTHDDKINEVLDLFCSGDTRVGKSLADLARKQPLLILRKIPWLSILLKRDATIDFESQQERRGVTTGQNVAGKRDAMFRGTLVQVSVLHWGYTFTESLWVAVLDVLFSMPREVLFRCGAKVGLTGLLETYLLLMSVHLQLLGANKAERVKTKLADAFSAFRETNPDGWQTWLRTKIEDSEVRHLLLSCNFISPQECSEARLASMLAS